MNKLTPPHTEEELEHIWHEVPPDYYQKGVSKNILQHLWHRGKLRNIYQCIIGVNVSPKNILDIGCASGWFLSELSRKFITSKCIGIDVYADAIAYGKKQYKNLTLLKADGHTVPFEKNTFDVIICNEVLEHVVDPEKVLAEIKRVLHPKGFAVIEMDTGNKLFQLVWYWWTHMRKGVWEHAHIQVFNTNILENMIRNAGFTIRKKKIFNMSMAVVFLVTKA